MTNWLPGGSIPVDWLKLQFALASEMAGIAGGLYAAYVSYIDPTSFPRRVDTDASHGDRLVGGTGNVRGPLVGPWY